MNEFILGVDLDGVCGQHTEIFREIVARELGVAEESLPLERSWDFREWGFGPDDFERLHRIAVMEHRMFRDMEVVPGCAETLWRLSDAGVWIRIVTHRLYVNWGHAVAIADTAQWLDEKRIPYRDVCFVGEKPDVAAHAYVDDGPHNVEGLREAGHTVFTFDQPYNRHIEGPRVSSWAELEDVVLKLAAAHAGSVAQQLPGLDAGSQRLIERTGDHS